MHKIRDRAKFVFKYFGTATQIRKLDEEHGELSRKLGLLEEGYVFLANAASYKKDLAQEIADNLFLLLQFAVSLDIEEEVYEQLDKKSQRTVTRALDGYYKQNKQK